MSNGTNSPHEHLEYKGCQIDVVEQDSSPALQIDQRIVPTQRDSATGAYYSPEAPYQEFGSLMEVGKAVVDRQEEEKA